MYPLLVQLHKYPSDGTNRGSGLQTSYLERRSWPITPLGMSSLDGQVVRNFKFPQGETIIPSRAPTGRKPGGSFSLSVFDAPAPPYPSAFCVILHIVQTCFPSFLTMPYLTHIDVIAACIFELSGTSSRRPLLAYVFFCFLEIVEIL